MQTDALDLADVLTSAIATATAPLLARIMALEKQLTITARENRAAIEATNAMALDTQRAGYDLHTRVAVLEQRAPVPGPRGERGETGERGSDGRPGIDGKNGASVFAGMGEPTLGGTDGDLYVDAVSGDVYQCR